MNLPNAISLFRIMLVPLFAALYIKGQTAAAMAVLLISGLSDVLDGAIARRYGLVTELGKILDPIADKLIQTAMMLCALRLCPAVWWLLAAHVLRELSLSLMGLYVIKSSGNVMGARWFGKACTVYIYAVMILLLAFPALPELYRSLAVYSCTGAVLACLFLYAGSYARILRGGEGPAEN